MAENKQSKKKIIIIVSVAVVLSAAACIMGVLTLKGFFDPKPPEHERGEGVVGIITDGWETGVEDTSSTKRSGTQIPGYSSAVMNEGDTTLHLSIGNPKENKVGFYATLKLEDGTVLYTSELINPGQGLTEVPLNQTLKKGTYDAIVEYQCVLLNDEHTPLNAAESAFTLFVN